MQTENVNRADASRPMTRHAQERRAIHARPYTSFARSGVWRFRPWEPLRPFKPFRLD